MLGDSYQNSLYLNPGQNNNRWINIALEGVTSNKAAISTKIKVTFETMVCKDRYTGM